MKDRPRVYGAAIGIWFVFCLVAFALGAVRELAMSPKIGEHAAHVVGTLCVVAVFLAIIYVFVRRVQTRCSAGDFWLIGLMWCVMTASFEFLFFHFVGGKSWDELFADYNVGQGRIWVLVLLTTLFGPAAVNLLLLRRSRDRS